MLNKEAKMRVLENFYALDYVYYGKPIQEVDYCCPGLVEDYISVKGALLSVMIEMYQLVDLNPEPIVEKVDSNDLVVMAKRSATVAREMCEKLVATPQGINSIKEDLRIALEEDESLDVSETVQMKIREKAYSLATDNLLIAKTISEAADYTTLNEWEGRIVEDAYKILRDSLVETAILITDYIDSE